MKINKSVIGILVVLLLVGFIGYIVLNSSNKNNNNVQISKEKNIVKIDKEDSDIIEENNLDDQVGMEKGFMTSIKEGNTEEEVVENNILLNSDKIKVEDKLLAKRTAENFVQALTSFDIDDKKETVDRASKYVDKDMKKDIENMFVGLGKNEDIKRTIIKSVYSEEWRNKDNTGVIGSGNVDNDYLYFYVSVSTNYVDNYDKEIEGNGETGVVKLLNEDGEYKVIAYYPKN